MLRLTYTLTILLSAYLLFLVQPMVTKIILPVFGGSPAVWNTAMVFYQACLLGGYIYAHYSLKLLGWKKQGVLHIVLLCAAILLLPILLPQGYQPNVDQPVTELFKLLIIIVGLPFFLLSASAPLLQRWFSHSNHPNRDNPYFLYAASNIGSIAALACYPFIMEPLLTLSNQSYVWSGCFIALAVGFIASYLVLYKNQQPVLAEAVANPSVITNKQKLLWVFYAAVPTSALLAITSHITTDVAVTPLLWVLPLLCYLLTFVIVFSNVFNKINLSLVSRLTFVLMILAVFAAYTMRVHAVMLILVVNLLILTGIGLICHGRMVQTRPGVDKLTVFYILMSLGGVIGGGVTALIAPILFNGIYEYYIVMCLAVLCFPKIAANYEKIKNSTVLLSILAIAVVASVFIFFSHAHVDNWHIFVGSVFGICAVLICVARNKDTQIFLMGGLVIAILFMEVTNPETITADRSFFGSYDLQTREYGEHTLLLLNHGTTVHGGQLTTKGRTLEPVLYYHLDYAIGDIFNPLRDKPPVTTAILGLGTGAAACTMSEKDHVDFFEIDPLILELAEDYFTFLSDCPPSNKTIIGDGRLTIQQQADKKYDVIYLDAFSSDAIPLHLLTEQAVDIYEEKLKDDGFFIFHISNRHLDLQPIVFKLAQHNGMEAFASIYTPEDLEKEPLASLTSFVVVAKPENIPASIRAHQKWEQLTTENTKDLKLWTDDYANILSVYK